MRLLALAILLAHSPLAAEDFSMFRGNPQRLGRLDSRLGAPASLLWKQEAGGSFYSSPAIVHGTIFLGNSDHHVYAYALKDGALQWKTELPERIYGSSPQIEGSLLYIACVNGCVYSLDLGSGEIKGQICVKANSLRSLLPRGPLGLAPPFALGADILGSPLVHDGRLYFGSDNHMIYAFNLKDGKEAWSFETGDKVHDAAPTLAGGSLFMAGMDGHLVCLDALTGKLLWKSEDFEKLNTTALAYQGRVYFGAGDRHFRCLDASSGKQIWSFEAPKGIMSSPALSPDGKRIVFGGSDGILYCLGMEGSLLWKFSSGGPLLASPLITGDTVWIGSFDKHFYGVSLSDGRQLFSMESSAGIFSSAASGKLVVVADRDGLLYCIQASQN
jgi:outer membrane protein assembly factor BamB